MIYERHIWEAHRWVFISRGSEFEFNLYIMNNTSDGLREDGPGANWPRLPSFGDLPKVGARKIGETVKFGFNNDQKNCDGGGPKKLNRPCRQGWEGID